MEATGLQIQAANPLFPKILWNRPVNKRAAGRLVTAGGHAMRFSQTQSAYLAAKAAGIGEAKVLLPKSVYKLTGSLPDCLFVPSTKSGSLAREAADFIAGAARDSDALLVGLEISHNAETTALVEGLLPRLERPVVIVDEGLEVMLHAAHTLEGNPSMVIAATMQQLLRLTNALELPLRIRSDDALLRKADFIHNLEKALQTPLVLLGPDMIVTTAEGTSSTPVPTFDPERLGEYAGVLATFVAQNPERLFEALTTACYVISKSKTMADIKHLLESED